MWSALCFVFVLFHSNCYVSAASLTNFYVNDAFLIERLSEDGRLNFTQISKKYGEDVEEHTVVTEDGYILTLFHLIGNTGRTPVILMHGILDSADTFIVRGSTSLAITLQKAGYDVWVGNARGTRHARKHVSLNPDTDVKFWDFSFHEIGYYDCSAIIDYVVSYTKKNVSVIAHSQGTAAFYVLAAKRPEYNEKINILISLAPIAFFNNVQAPAKYAMDISDPVNQILMSTGQEELFADHTLLRALMSLLCIQRPINYALCAHGLIMAFAGRDPKQFEPQFLYTLMGHYPASTSRKSLNHYVQIKKAKRFSEYDYGRERNLQLYKAEQPPSYDLHKVSMKVSMICGKNDLLSSLEDVRILRRKLPNVVHYFVMQSETFNHVDFVWGRFAYKTSTPRILDVLRKFGSDDVR